MGGQGSGIDFDLGGGGKRGYWGYKREMFSKRDKGEVWGWGGGDWGGSCVGLGGLCSSSRPFYMMGEGCVPQTILGRGGTGGVGTGAEWGRWGLGCGIGYLGGWGGGGAPWHFMLTTWFLLLHLGIGGGGAPEGDGVGGGGARGRDWGGGLGWAPKYTPGPNPGQDVWGGVPYWPGVPAGGGKKQPGAKRV